ncbi:MAG TPA: UvrD-helicase domain-containing protein [Geothrix sp.]|nr:UvrD-helicase domain-containing protein [Geothrix sp.]
MRDLDLSDLRLLDQSLVVSASAGSGKTFTLSVLVTANLGREDIRSFEILATTFSEASAADLRERLLRPLDLLAALAEPAWKALLPLLEAPEAKAIEAHLKALPLPDRLRKAAGEVAQAAAHWRGAAWKDSTAKARAFWRRTRREAELLQVSTIHSLAMRVMSRGEGAAFTILDVEHPGLLRLLRQTVRETLTLPEGHPDEAAAKPLLAWAERNWEHLSRAHDNHQDAMGSLVPEAAAPYRDRLTSALERAELAMAPFAAQPMLGLDPASSTKRFFKPSCILQVPAAGADLAARLRWANSQSGRVEAEKGYYSERLREAMATFEPVADALEAWLRCLLVEALGRFEHRKQELAMATFGDLVRKALRSLQSGGLEGQPPKLLLVDEYQDTSRSQDAFLAALDAERIVRVGDIKQAIYGFRGGDPDLLRQHLAQAGEGAFRLPSNFRSTPEVVALANRFVDEVWPQLDPGAGDLDGAQVAALPEGVPVGLVRRAMPASWANLPALSDWIAGLSRDAGWQQSLGEASKPAPRRRALLLKQRTRLPALLQRLKAQDIQPYVVAKAGFWDSPGVRLFMAGLEAVAHPERPLPCAALLRQVVGMSDGEITRLAWAKEGRSGLPGLGSLDPEHLPEQHREGARWLLDLRQATTQELAGRLLRQGAVLRAIRALGVHGAMEPLRARRNLAAFLAMLLDLPASVSTAYALLEEERAGAERGDLPALAEDADLIIQTVHGSKGLEYEDVILPLLHARPRSFQKGEIRTRPGTGALQLAWKLGNHPGLAYRELKPVVEARQKQDDLNLLYVALTRSRERLCLLLQEPKRQDPPEASKTWAQYGQHLAAAHPELKALEEAPLVAPLPKTAEVALERPPLRAALSGTTLVPDAHEGMPADGRAKARQEGEAVHAFLRDLLVRWEDAKAFSACLEAAPAVPQVRENALRFLQQFEARGWRHLRRRAELPLEGAAASGALGRADLVVWSDDRIHLLDFKHSKTFGEEELAGYGDQLVRYANALKAREGRAVEAWLVALRSGEWVDVPTSSPA